MSSQNTIPEQLEAPRAAKQRRSIKSPQVKEAVIAHALIGASNTQIAKDLQIDRATVKNILTSAEIQQHIEVGRSDCVRMIPQSVRVIRQRLEKGSETAALSVLRGTQVLVNQQIASVTNNFQANTWLVMKQQKQAEQAQVIEVQPDTTTNSDKP
jgi:DNA-binding MarR family transcriptional regulator